VGSRSLAHEKLPHGAQSRDQPVLVPQGARRDVRWKIPPFDERLPETYEDEEIDLLLGACDAHHRAAYSVMDTATHPRWLIWSEAI
jgi:hypothetical protein